MFSCPEKSITGNVWRFLDEFNFVAFGSIDKSKTEGTTLYVVRVDKSGDLKLSKPCPMCYAALKHAGIKKVVFSLNSHTCGSYKIK